MKQSQLQIEFTELELSPETKCRLTYAPHSTQHPEGVFTITFEYADRRVGASGANLTVDEAEQMGRGIYNFVQDLRSAYLNPKVKP